VLSGVALTASSVQAARFGERHGITHAERAAIARSQANLNALKWRARADGHVTLWERARTTPRRPGTTPWLPVIATTDARVGMS